MKDKEAFDLTIQRLNSKKAIERRTAVFELIDWYNTKNIGKENKALIINEFNSRLEEEKNEDIISHIKRFLKSNDKEKSLDYLSKDEFIDNTLKGVNDNLFSWLEIETLPKVKINEKENCDLKTLKAIFYLYSAHIQIFKDKDVERLIEDFNKEDLEVLANEVFDRWIENKAESSKKWAMVFGIIYGGEKIVPKALENINSWSKISRGSIAADAVKALAFNKSKDILLKLDGMSMTFKHKQVKNAAKLALEMAANEIGISKEELSDKIIPSLGFDKNGERIFDYGTRSFKVVLTPNLALEVYDETGKKLKNIPFPGKKDDEEKAKNSHKEFKDVKKQLKTIVSVQSKRFDMALSTNRRWSKDLWIEVFVGNPIMHNFATGLIWGIYDGIELIDTFRYMEDGTFNTKNEEEFEMPKSCNIGLVHPLELSQEDLNLWKEQLDSYEVVQPIEQLYRNCYVVSEEEMDKKLCERFGGIKINGYSLTSKLLTKYGWNRGEILDGAGYYEFIKEDKNSNINAELSIEGLSIGIEYENTTVYDLKFYDRTNIKRQNYGKISNESLLYLKDVPKKLFSETLKEITEATISSDERDENWKKK